MLESLKIDPEKHRNEAFFIRSFKAGDPSAFECIFHQMYEPLTMSATTLTKSEKEAEDITSGAFIKLYTHGRKQVRTLEHIKRWMFIVVRNDSINYLKRRKLEREAQRFFADREHIRVQRYSDKDDTAFLQYKATYELEKLPKRKKTILRLYYFGERSTREIASLLQIDPQTVLNHKTKALESLRQCFMGRRRVK